VILWPAKSSSMGWGSANGGPATAGDAAEPSSPATAIEKSGKQTHNENKPRPTGMSASLNAPGAGQLRVAKPGLERVREIPIEPQPQPLEGSKICRELRALPLRM
jgi:hypothetical protein